MFRACLLIITLTGACLSGAAGFLLARPAYPRGLTAARTQRPLRVALIGFAPFASDSNGAEARAIESSFKDALARDARVSITEPSQLRSALAGIKYGGSINMSKDEARRLGAAIGCDFFIVGKAEVFTRSEREREEHEEAFVGVMIVESRSGALAVFDFVNARASTRVAALDVLIRSLNAKVAVYAQRMNESRMRREAVPAQTAPPRASDVNASALETVEDMTDVESAVGAGFKAPEFLNHVKPEYTDEAGRANITATVEALAVFRANGEIGEIEITRWAGFGLDEAAERAIRQLKFRPATRNSRPVSVRASVRYNFRRIGDSALSLRQRQQISPY
jgi:TonB family protein